MSLTIILKIVAVLFSRSIPGCVPISGEVIVSPARGAVLLLVEFVRCALNSPSTPGKVAQRKVIPGAFSYLFDLTLCRRAIVHRTRRTRYVRAIGSCQYY